MNKKLKILEGLLPICSYCKSIRDEHHQWVKLESYIKNHSQAEFTHGICPDCMEKAYQVAGIDSKTPLVEKH